jgi:hypothetical protein
MYQNDETDDEQAYLTLPQSMKPSPDTLTSMLHLLLYSFHFLIVT